MEKEIPKFYVINWDVNKDDIEYYDIIPYLIDCWNKQQTRKYKTWSMHDDKSAFKNKTSMPSTYEEFKEFILNESFSLFWGNCNYEIIITGWPVQKRERKIDVYEQIKQNIDTVTKLFIEYITQN